MKIKMLYGLLIFGFVAVSLKGMDIDEKDMTNSFITFNKRAREIRIQFDRREKTLGESIAALLSTLESFEQSLVNVDLRLRCLDWIGGMVRESNLSRDEQRLALVNMRDNLFGSPNGAAVEYRSPAVIDALSTARNW